MIGDMVCCQTVYDPEVKFHIFLMALFVTWKCLSLAHLMSGSFLGEVLAGFLSLIQLLEVTQPHLV